MKSTIIVFVVVTGIFSAFLFSDLPNSASVIQDEEVAQILRKNCSTTGCHQGRFPPMNLDLDPSVFKKSLIDIPSQGLPHLKLVDTEDIEKSYLLMKINGDKAIQGKQMPINAPPLDEKEIETIKKWIRDIKPQSSEAPSRKDESPEEKKQLKPAFWGTRLVNLPTTQTIDKGNVLFRISHRYFPSVSDGYDAFYGLDGPAVILLSLGYGINDRLNVSLARSNRFKEVEFSLKWIILDQKDDKILPVSAALNVGGAFITDVEAGKKTFRSENFKFSALLSVSHQFSNAFSLLLVPAYSSNTNHWENSSEGTLSLGVGARYMFLKDMSIIAEWVPVISGYEAGASGWGFGIERKIGGHVFQVFFTNSIGMTSAQFIPGGNLRLQDGDFRIGFNIFRLF
jgi:hypothetical protein